MATMTIPTEAVIFERVIESEKGDLPPDVARYILSLDFRPRDKQRMHDLAVQNQAGRLAADERDELGRYVNVGQLLALLQSKARKSLKRSASPE